MARKNNNKQPLPEKGYEFTGWAVFNWGISHDRVFRTRKEAQEYCYKLGGKCVKNRDGSLREPSCWNEVKNHMAVVKVKCKVV